MKQATAALSPNYSRGMSDYRRLPRALNSTAGRSKHPLRRSLSTAEGDITSPTGYQVRVTGNYFRYMRTVSNCRALKFQCTRTNSSRSYSSFANPRHTPAIHHMYSFTLCDKSLPGRHGRKPRFHPIFPPKHPASNAAARSWPRTKHLNRQ